MSRAYSTNALEGFGRTALQQAVVEAENALRVLAIAQTGVKGMCPDPRIIARAQLRQAIEFVELDMRQTP